MQTLSLVALVPLLASMIAGVIIPSIVDLVTHSTAPWWLKSALATALAAIAGAVSTTVWQPDAGVKVYVFNILTAFVLTFTSHQAGSSEIVEGLTGSYGLGKQSRRALPSGAVLAPPSRDGGVSKSYVDGAVSPVRRPGEGESERLSMAVPQRADEMPLPRHELNEPLSGPGGVGVTDDPPMV